MNNTNNPTSSSQQALWFLVVGASAAAVHFIVLVSIVSITSVTPAWANVIAFFVAFIVSFLGHFYLTFRQSSANNNSSGRNNNHINDSQPLTQKSTHPVTCRPFNALIKWFASSSAGFIANQGLFVLGLNWFGERYYIFIWLIVTGVITVMTFSLAKIWAFKS